MHHNLSDQPGDTVLGIELVFDVLGSQLISSNDDIEAETELEEPHDEGILEIVLRQNVVSCSNILHAIFLEFIDEGVSAFSFRLHP